jgi:hypothetical protein
MSACPNLVKTHCFLQRHKGDWAPSEPPGLARVQVHQVEAHHVGSSEGIHDLAGAFTNWLGHCWVWQGSSRSAYPASFGDWQGRETLQLLTNDLFGYG